MAPFMVWSAPPWTALFLPTGLGRLNKNNMVRPFGWALLNQAPSKARHFKAMSGPTVSVSTSPKDQCLSTILEPREDPGKGFRPSTRQRLDNCLVTPKPLNEANCVDSDTLTGSTAGTSWTFLNAINILLVLCSSTTFANLLRTEPTEEVQPGLLHGPR